MVFELAKLQGFGLYTVAFHSCRGKCDGEQSVYGSLSYDEMLWIVSGLLRCQTRDAEAAPDYIGDDAAEWTLTCQRSSCAYWLVTDDQGRFAHLQNSEVLAFIAGRGSVRYGLQSYEDWHRLIGRHYPKPVALIPQMEVA
jgi:hypothetical protein